MPKLSFKAQGLYYFIIQKPEDYIFTMKDFREKSKDGKDSVNNGINELVEAKLFYKLPIKTKDGRFAGFSLKKV